MYIVTLFWIQIAVTLTIVALILRFLRSSLRRILIDLCGTEDRAQFWTTFTNIVLLSLPMISALGFPPTISLENPLIATANQLKSNLTIFILGLVMIGVVLLFFTIVASSKTNKT